jgi:hypothetical protein
MICANMTEKYFRQKINMGSKNTELYAKSKNAKEDKIMYRKKSKSQKTLGKSANSEKLKVHDVFELGS